uniref:Uncharacterized protein n=1 Tax=Setaria italica TaxID=4555 RepID=K3YNT4_SETIT
MPACHAASPTRRDRRHRPQPPMIIGVTSIARRRVGSLKMTPPRRARRQ